jgi:cell division septum initiation protein DivIVA
MAKTIRNISNIESLNTDIKYLDGKAVFIKAGQAIDTSKFDQDSFNKSLKDGMIGKMIDKKWLIMGETIIGTAVNTQKLADEAKINAEKQAADLKAKIAEDEAKIVSEKKIFDEENPIIQ